jgi:aspartate racemase
VNIEGHRTSVLGVVGGMGPLASAEFLKTIYEYNLGEREQDSPIVLMYSDPSFPDRTQALLTGIDEDLLVQLTQTLRRLLDFGVSEIVICCITIHHLLPNLPDEVRRHVLSLLDVIFSEVASSRKRHLLVCTTGARKAGIFERHPKWESLKDRFVLPDESDQELIHDVIYQIKSDCDIGELIPFLETLLLKYEVDSFIAGCTEIHLLAKQFLNSQSYPGTLGCVDPLDLVAQNIAGKKVQRRANELRERAGVV